MSPVNKNQIKRRIIRLLKQNPGADFSAREISANLDIHKNTYKLFKKALHECTDDGNIIRKKGGKYSYLQPQPAIIGKIMLTKNGSGFVWDEEKERDIFIPPPLLNTALNGDTVEVKLNAVQRGRSAEGRVVRIVQRARTLFAGTFHKGKFYSFVVIDDPRIKRDFLIPKGTDEIAKDGQVVAVELVQWKDASLNPEGRIVDVLGYADEKGVDVSAVMVNNGLPLSFPESVEAEARKIPTEITPAMLEGRLDLREQLIFTIDPVDAKDFDDAVSLETTENGNLLLGVHIADVSHYVREGSDLDEEALTRSTSVYMVDRVVPMLPEKLSNEVCSLRPEEDKLTFSCLMELDAQLKVVDYTIQESVIHSKRRLNYQEAQQMIDSGNQKDQITSHLIAMNQLAKRLKKQRLATGGLDFFTPEVKFILDEKGFPVDIVPVTVLDTHQLIEEFMLMANKVVANHLSQMGSKNHRYPSIYRIHEKPDDEKFNKFLHLLNILGYSFTPPAKVNPFFFQEVLNKVKGSPDESLIDKVALRTMMKARYSLENLGHFGLGFSYYTHFTSPIRRYPDLIVHRLLKKYRSQLSSHERDSLEKHLKKIADHASSQERVAMDAERESIKIKQAEWLSRHIGEEFDGIISGVAPYGIFVEIKTVLAEGMVHMDHMDDDIYIYDEATYSLTGRDSGRILRMGSPVRVQLVKVDTDKHEVDFRIVDVQESDRKTMTSFKNNAPKKKSNRQRRRRRPIKKNID